MCSVEMTAHFSRKPSHMWHNEQMILIDMSDKAFIGHTNCHSQQWWMGKWNSSNAMCDELKQQHNTEGHHQALHQGEMQQQWHCRHWLGGWWMSPFLFQVGDLWGWRGCQVVKVGVVKFVEISSERLTLYTSKDTIGSGKYVVLLHRKLIQI
jgi:hypothetical protein